MSGKVRGTVNGSPSFDTLISGWRFRPTTQGGRTLNVEAESDRARVIYNEAFRALHRKAQVFSLDDKVSSRTRLTHSLEVSQVGRYLTQIILDDMRPPERKALAIHDKAEAIQVFVETSCLVHDIGNPPFGHFGELAIRHWFERKMPKLRGQLCESASAREEEFSSIYKDFLEFDGNPQGFRILSRLMWVSDEFSLNLTATQLAASVKYFCSPTEIDTENPLRKKAGYFSSEVAVAGKIREVLGMRKFSRHPLAYLMEAADDIAYCLSDIEDAIARDLFSESDVIADVISWVREKPTLASLFTDLPASGNFVQGDFLRMRVRLINSIVGRLALYFKQNAARYFVGDQPPLVDAVPEVSEVLNCLKRVAREKIYCSPDVLRNEIIGSRVISGILDVFEPILDARRDRFDSMMRGASRDTNGSYISVEHALLRQIPDMYKKVYQHSVQGLPTQGGEVRAWSARAHMIVDFVASLTDVQALDFYRLISAR